MNRLLFCNRYAKYLHIIICCLIICHSGYAQTASSNNKNLQFFKADHKYIQYAGRIDFTNPALPKFWAPGVYIKARFLGTRCEIIMNDEIPQANYHNYLEIVIDNKKPFRIRLNGKKNIIRAAGGLSDEVHSITICKNTEAAIGFVEFAGLKCKALMPPDSKPIRKMEFIGNSITCGSESDASTISCNAGQWYDKQNAYMSYGPLTARNLKAEWQISAVSGIGLIQSANNMAVTMPDVFDKVNMRKNEMPWNFKKFQPHVVTICLGENDGVQHSATFCSAYLKFINKIRSYYTNAEIICLNSVMADANLSAVLNKYITSVVDTINASGDNKVTKYFFSKRYTGGCGEHPNLDEHRQMANELTAYIRTLKGW